MPPGPQIGPRAGIVALILLASNVTLVAQPIPVVRVGQPSTTSREPFSSVGGLRELSDGRVLITDGTEVSVRILDFRSGSAHPIGRSGSGPREYTRPGPLYPAGGDTTLLLDLGGRRLLTILPDGQLLNRVLSLPVVSGGFKPPRGVDARGRTYFDLADILAPGLEISASRGIAPVLRWTPATSQVDTIAEIGFPPMGPVPGGASMRPMPPYQPRDAWAVDRDGRVAVVRHAPYRVEWFLPERSQSVVGPIVSHEPVPIGRAERDAWLDRLAQGPGIVVSQGGDRRTVSPPRPSVGQFDWPAHKPPFEGGAWISPDREVWVQRSRPATAARPIYDVFDRAGRPVRQVELPAGRRIVGFGTRGLYAVRTDDDGLLWLERYDRRDLGGSVP